MGRHAIPQEKGLALFDGSGRLPEQTIHAGPVEQHFHRRRAPFTSPAWRPLSHLLKPIRDLGKGDALLAAGDGGDHHHEAVIGRLGGRAGKNLRFKEMLADISPGRAFQSFRGPGLFALAKAPFMMRTTSSQGICGRSRRTSGTQSWAVASRRSM